MSSAKNHFYRTDGAKIKKVYSSKGQLTGDETYSIKKTFTEYIDGFQYEAFVYFGTAIQFEPIQVLKFIPTTEGYYNF